MAEPQDPKVVTLGLDIHSKNAVQLAAPGQPLLDWEFDLEKLLEMPVVPAVRVILVGPPPKDVQLNEIAQFLRMQYPDTTLFHLTSNRTGFVRKDFVKNGFNDAFLIPLETATFVKLFTEELAKASQGKTRAFRSIKLVDVQPGQAMDFDTFIHLPNNNKHIRFSAAGDAIDPERAQRLANHKVGALHIHAQDRQKFYTFTAEQLRKLGSSDEMSTTEKRDRMQSAVRELISDMFQDSSADATFDKGKEVMQDCQEIVKAYIMGAVSGTDNKWYQKLMELSQSESAALGHTASTSTFAALFSMSLGIGNPEHLALAGLLHDIGLSEISADILAKAPEDWSADERLAYQRHPKVSVALIQNRKMVVPELVHKIIGQHHERYDGKGYPDAKSGNSVRPESQVLALADHFSYLISPALNRPAYTPSQAMDLIYQTIPATGDAHAYDPEIVRKLYEIFKPQ